MILAPKCFYTRNYSLLRYPMYIAMIIWDWITTTSSILTIIRDLVTTASNIAMIIRDWVTMSQLLIRKNTQLSIKI